MRRITATATPRYADSTSTSTNAYRYDAGELVLVRCRSCRAELIDWHDNNASPIPTKRGCFLLKRVYQPRSRNRSPSSIFLPRKVTDFARFRPIRG